MRDCGVCGGCTYDSSRWRRGGFPFLHPLPPIPPLSPCLLSLSLPLNISLSKSLSGRACARVRMCAPALGLQPHLPAPNHPTHAPALLPPQPSGCCLLKFSKTKLRSICHIIGLSHVTMDSDHLVTQLVIFSNCCQFLGRTSSPKKTDGISLDNSTCDLSLDIPRQARL